VSEEVNRKCPTRNTMDNGTTFNPLQWPRVPQCTDRQTDRQTDRRQYHAKSRSHYSSTTG